MKTDLEKIVLDRLVTKKDVGDLLDTIDLLLNTLYQKDGDAFDKTLSTSVDEWFSDIVRGLEKNGLQKEDFLKSIGEMIKSLEEVKITIHEPPNERLKEAIKNWIDANLGTKVVADFEIKKSILGGAIISYKGKYVDYSLRKRLDSVLTKMKPQIVKSLTISHAKL